MRKQEDGLSDTMKLIVAFRDCAKPFVMVLASPKVLPVRVFARVCVYLS